MELAIISASHDGDQHKCHSIDFFRQIIQTE
jgi:hypothetical protein